MRGPLQPRGLGLRQFHSHLHQIVIDYNPVARWHASQRDIDLRRRRGAAAKLALKRAVEQRGEHVLGLAECLALPISETRPAPLMLAKPC
jgi:hypothetical protein